MRKSVIGVIICIAASCALLTLGFVGCHKNSDPDVVDWTSANVDTTEPSSETVKDVPVTLGYAGVWRGFDVTKRALINTHKGFKQIFDKYADNWEYRIMSEKYTEDFFDAKSIMVYIHPFSGANIEDKPFIESYSAEKTGNRLAASAIYTAADSENGLKDDLVIVLETDKANVAGVYDFCFEAKTSESDRLIADTEGTIPAKVAYVCDNGIKDQDPNVCKIAESREELTEIAAAFSKPVDTLIRYDEAFFATRALMMYTFADRYMLISSKTTEITRADGELKIALSYNACGTLYYEKNNIVFIEVNKDDIADITEIKIDVEADYRELYNELGTPTLTDYYLYPAPAPCEAEGPIYDIYTAYCNGYLKKSDLVDISMYVYFDCNVEEEFPDGIETKIADDIRAEYLKKHGKEDKRKFELDNLGTYNGYTVAIVRYTDIAEIAGAGVEASLDFMIDGVAFKKTPRLLSGELIVWKESEKKQESDGKNNTKNEASAIAPDIVGLE